MQVVHSLTSALGVDQESQVRNNLHLPLHPSLAMAGYGVAGQMGQYAWKSYE